MIIKIYKTATGIQSGNNSRASFKNKRFLRTICSHTGGWNEIQKNLVWDKRTGELIEDVDPGDIELNYATLPKVNKITSHIVVFFVCSVVNPFKFSLANFAAKDIQASQIFPLL